MSSLVIDIGNTRSKSAVVNKGKLTDFMHWNQINDLGDFVNANKFDTVLLCSVGGLENRLMASAGANQIKLLTSYTPLPIKLHYSTKNTLGPDRIAGVMGAFHEFPNQNSLVIDIGTCVTYDFLSKDNVFLGGAISPGLNLRLRSMADYTSKLPLVELEEDGIPELIGDSSASSIKSGVVNGMLNEIEGFIKRFTETYKRINVIITGGDSDRFETKIKAPIFVAPKLVLLGLKRILEYNEEI